MCRQLSYSVSTVLPRDRAWELFAEIENWPKISDVYNDLRWSGFPWTRHSCILGSIRYPHPLPLRYVIEKCEPASIIRYVAHGIEGAHGLKSIRMLQVSQRLRLLAEATGS
jgi:hypothetical protein